MTQHRVELDVHLRQGFVDVLHASAAVSDQLGALAHVGTQPANRVRGTKRASQQTVAHQLPDPLAVEHVALAATDLFGRPRVHQVHREPRPVQHLEHRNPVHPRGLHRHRIDRARVQPLRHRLQLVSEAGEGANRPLGRRLRHRDVVLGLAYIDTRTPRTNHPQRLLALASHRSISHHGPRSCRVKPWRKAHSCMRGRGNPRAISDSTPITTRATLKVGCEHTSDGSASHPARPPVIRRNATVFLTRQRGGPPPGNAQRGDGDRFGGTGRPSVHR